MTYKISFAEILTSLADLDDDAMALAETEVSFGEQQEVTEQKEELTTDQKQSFHGMLLFTGLILLLSSYMFLKV